jgi:hypothetical protein
MATPRIDYGKSVTEDTLMPSTTWICGLINTTLALVIALSPSILAQDKNDKELPPGKPVLWRDPGDVASRNLLLGPGGEAMKPDVSKVTFVKDESGGGYSKKYRVKDAAGRTWVAKLSSEGQPESVSDRLMWAIGYTSEISYLIPEVTIEGKGTFKNVRFEARPDNIKRVGGWSWDKNPFIGTQEYQGLKVMMLVLNNWDIKDDNTRIIHIRNEQTGEDELHYIVSDLGATFGKTGSFFSRSRNKPEDYAKVKFIKGVRGEYVDFNYGGKRGDLFERISVQDARWLGALLARLTDEQIMDAFRAANYDQQEVRLLTEAFQIRVNELNSLGVAAR